MSRIRVLIADDDEVYRGGLRLTLETDANIEIVGEAIVIDQVVPLIQSLQPDVLVLDMRWGRDEDAGLRNIPFIKGHSATRIVAISAYDDLVLRAKSIGADAALPKEFPAAQLRATIEAVCEENFTDSPIIEVEKQARHLARQLIALAPGNRDAKGYERLMEQVLPFLFAKHLSNFKRQSRSRGGAEIFDLIAYIESSHPFWANLRDHYASEQIIFDMKNTATLKVVEVLKLARYLRKRTIHVGVIVTRTQLTKGALGEAHKMFATGDDLVLFLTDDHIREMLKMKRQGGEPTDLLNRVYLELTRE